MFTIAESRTIIIWVVRTTARGSHVRVGVAELELMDGRSFPAGGAIMVTKAEEPSAS
jgi:hypothetical protein